MTSLVTTDRVTEADTLLRLPDVLKLIPLSKPAWKRGVSRGHYPKPVKISARAVAWRKSDIQSLIASFK